MRARDARETLVAKLCFRANVAHEARARRTTTTHADSRFTRWRLGFGRMRVSVTTRENVRRERVVRVATSVTSKRGSRSSPLKKRDGTRFETRWRRRAGRDRAGCAAGCARAASPRAQAGRSMQVADDAAQRAAEIWRVVARSPSDGCGSRRRAKAAASHFRATPILSKRD